MYKAAHTHHLQCDHSFLTLCHVPNNTSESWSSFKSGAGHQQSPGTSLDLQTMLSLHSTRCHYAGTRSTLAFTNKTLARESTRPPAKHSRMATKRACREYQTEEEKDKEGRGGGGDGGDGGNDAQHAPLCLTALNWSVGGNDWPHYFLKLFTTEGNNTKTSSSLSRFFHLFVLC